MYKVICFDFDDVIIDTNLMIQLSQRFGNKLKEFKLLFNFLVKDRRNHNKFSSIHDIAKTTRGMDFQKLKKICDYVKLTPGTVSTLEKLKKEGFEIVIVSVNDKRIINHILEKHKIKYYFSDIFASELDTENGVLTGKINGEVVDTKKLSVLDKIKEKYNVDEKHIMYVADGVTDIPLFKKLGHGVFFCPSFVTKTVIYRDPKLVKMEKNNEIKIVEHKNLTEILPFVNQKMETKHNVKKWYRSFWKNKFND